MRITIQLIFTCDGFSMHCACTKNASAANLCFPASRNSISIDRQFVLHRPGDVKQFQPQDKPLFVSSAHNFHMPAPIRTQHGSCLLAEHEAGVLSLAFVQGRTPVHWSFRNGSGACRTSSRPTALCKRKVMKQRFRSSLQWSQSHEPVASFI